MSELTENLPQWKKLWQMVSGIHFSTPKNLVQEKLLIVSKELHDGLDYYRANNQDAVIRLETTLKKNKQEKLLSIVTKLHNFLDLDALQAWELMCYYFVNEYRGPGYTLTNYISNEVNIHILFVDILHYYSLERMTLLKIIKLMLEYHREPTHPYSSEFNQIISKLGYANLRKSYLKQLTSLIKDVPNSRPKLGDLLGNINRNMLYAERTCRETIEILHILLLIIHFDGITPNETKTLFNLFKVHSFGSQQPHLIHSNVKHHDLMMRVRYSEITVLLTIFGISNIEFLEECIRILDSDILSMQHYPEHGPILLVWTLIQFTISDLINDPETAIKYQKCGMKALDLDVFKYLYSIIDHTMFKDSSLVSRLIRKSIFDHLSRLCDLFDDDGSMAYKNHVYDLLAELLQYPILAKDFVENEDIGVRSLYNTAMENFPVDMISLSKLGVSLIKSSNLGYSFIDKQMEQLPYYSEILENDKYLLTFNNKNDEECSLAASYRPFTGINYEIPIGTKAIIIRKKLGTLIHFNYPVNYFDVLHNEISQLLFNASHFKEINGYQFERLTQGIRYLSATLEKIASPISISEAMVHPAEMVFDVLVKFKEIQNPPIELMAECFRVCTKMVPLFEQEVHSRIVNLNILPIIDKFNLNYKSCSSEINFEPGMVGRYLVKFEKDSGRYNFLTTYLIFLKTYSKLPNRHVETIELPGLLFLTHEIFPHVFSWRFEKERHRFQIYSLILQYIFDIVQLDEASLSKDPGLVLLRNTCLHSLLFGQNGYTILRFIGMGNSQLHSIMENEINWISGSNLGMNYIVQLSMTILMHVLRLKYVIEPGEATPIESLIYTQPKQWDTLRIIPMVCSYMENIFNRHLPTLSCRLLKRFAIEFQLSLLACLDMEADQIRIMFLNRLRDSLESEDLKKAILEFVDSCVDKQPGLTEAFFKVKYENRDTYLSKMVKCKNIGESIISYMVEYLDAVGQDSNKVTSPLLSRIMCLFNTLWKNNLQVLVKDLVKNSKFWTSFCNPLFDRKIMKTNKAYSQLFNILGIELFRCNNANPMNENLEKTFVKFLEPKVISEWLQIVFTMTDDTDSMISAISEDTPEWLCRQQSFKELLIVILRKNLATVRLSNESKVQLAEICVLEIMNRIAIFDIRTVIILSELFLITLISLNEATKLLKIEEMIGNISILLDRLDSTYESVHVRAKEAILTSITKFCEIYFTCSDDKEVVVQIFKSAVNIMIYEITHINNTIREVENLEDNRKILTFKLSVNLVKELVMNLNKSNVQHWHSQFACEKIFRRILGSISQIVQLYNYRQLSVELIDLTIIFSHGPCATEMIHGEIDDSFWLKLLPPKELIISTIRNNKVISPGKWQPQDWWEIYSKSIELVTSILQRTGVQFARQAINFVGVHMEYLVDSLLLSKYTLEPKALPLVKSALGLVAEIAKYDQQWRFEHSQSLFNLMGSIQILFDHCVSLLYRPKILKQLIEGNDDFSDIPIECSPLDPSLDLIVSMNKLIEIISICSQCLLHFSPKLMDLLIAIEFEPCKWPPLIEIQFSAPKLVTAELIPNLTFGTVLSAMCLLTQALNLNHHKFQINSSTSVDNSLTQQSIESKIAIRSSVNSLLNNWETNTNSTSTKSISISRATSVASTIAVTPHTTNIDLLIGIDTQTCLTALEGIATLLAAQSLLALKSDYISARDKQLIKREINSELTIFHDYVKKNILVDTNNILIREKIGCYEMSLECSEYSTDDLSSSDLKSSSTSSPPKIPKVPSRRSIRDSDSMRINVLRNEQLKQVQHTGPGEGGSGFDMTMPVSPIGIRTSQRNVPEASTPIVSKLSEDLNMYTNEEESQIFFKPNEPTFTNLSFIKFAEKDYLHMLSLVFHLICQTD